MTQPDLFQHNTSGADMDGIYRYSLARSWSDTGPRALFVMLNPSTADHTQDDPTIRRCISFAKREGCGGLTVVNLFALRATDPAELAKATHPEGPRNDGAIVAAAKAADLVICAWGAHPKALSRSKWVLSALLADVKLYRLGPPNKNGSPRHPLYIGGQAPLDLWYSPATDGRPG